MLSLGPAIDHFGKKAALAIGPLMVALALFLITQAAT
jgi:hypothetical protein